MHSRSNAAWADWPPRMWNGEAANRRWRGLVRALPKFGIGCGDTDSCISGQAQWLDCLETVVPEFARRPCLPVAGCKDDIRHLTGRDEVYAVGVMPGPLAEGLKELPHRNPRHCIRIIGVHDDNACNMRWSPRGNL